MGGACFRKDYATAGSGSVFMAGYLEKNYRKDMSFKECREMMLIGKGFWWIISYFC